MTYFLKFIQFLNTGILSICKYLTIVIMASLAVVVLIGAFYRYVLNDSLAWIEEIARFLLLYLTFMGAPIALKQGIHASIDGWIYRLPPWAGFPLLSFLNVMIMSFCLILIKLGTAFAINAKIQFAPYTQICMMYIFMVIPIGAFFLFMVSLEQLTNIIIANVQIQKKAETDI